MLAVPPQPPHLGRPLGPETVSKYHYVLLRHTGGTLALEGTLRIPPVMDHA